LGLLLGLTTIKVLACTATLAWGVNLPAHGVIIKGTQIYDPQHGKFVDLSILDVLQIFGRAGRPGMESSGVGFICTSEDKLQHYLEAVTAQVNASFQHNHNLTVSLASYRIQVSANHFAYLYTHHQSRLVHGILDALNAEISLGTVTNVPEGAEWLGYTYLFVRMRKNPMVYGKFCIN
jgi:antiviral helicase SLH1